MLLPLLSLMFQNSGMAHHCDYHITNDDIISLAQSHPGLVSIDLSGCYRLTIDGIQILAKLCKQLSSITLCDLPDSDGEGIDPHGYGMRKFAEKYPNIRIITGSSYKLARSSEHEEEVRKIQAAQEAERRRREKRILDILGDDRINQ